MNYLITGGAGFIGSHLVDALLGRGERVTVLDDLSTGRRENVEGHIASSAFELVEGSVLDQELVDELVGAHDVVVHLASAVGVQLVVDQPLDSLLRNVRGNDIVISAAARHGRRLVFSSTSEVYGKNSSDALSEDADRVLGSPYKSRWAYATAKAFGEALAYGYHRERGMPAVVVRLFNTVGPRQRGAYGMVLPRFVRQALAGEELSVYGNGAQSRCFVHVLDSVNAILMLTDAELATGRVFNVGSEREITIIELAGKVIERSGSRSAIRLVPYDEAYAEGFEELGKRKPDTGAMRQLTGWEPVRDIDAIIDDVIAYERSGASEPGGVSLA
jgi:UDP-glucose 4-epimerase